LPIEMERVGRVFGDRVLVRRLERPEKVGRFYIPDAYVKDKQKDQELWFGVIEKFGLDSRYSSAYDLHEGDIVGIDNMGSHSAGFEGDDRAMHVWVAEEFLVVKSLGRVEAFREGKECEGVGLKPIGPYAIVEPHPEETKRGGIVLPLSAQVPSRTGKVLDVSVGEDKGGSRLRPLNINTGSDVIYGRFSGSTAKFGDKVFLLVKEEDCIAELEPVKETANVA
jgi:chaperonin GroES